MAPVTQKLQSSVSLTEKNKCNDDEILLLLNKLDMKIDKNHEDICEKINQQAISHREELSRNLDEFESKMDDKLQNALSSHSSQIDRFTTVMENNDRLAKLNDVILRGIPATKNECLLSIFDLISSAIGFESKRSAVYNIFRIGIGMGINQKINSPILVKFLSLILKRDFMTKYIAHRELNLSAIGMDSAHRIYASDNLTKLNFDIQQKAVKLLKEKKNLKIIIRSGLVHVKFQENAGFVKILHAKDLMNEVSGHTSID